MNKRMWIVKTKKTLLPLILAVAMMLCLCVPAFAATSDTGFSDVAADAWYAEAVTYVRDNGLMSGTGETTFSPEATMTRAMLATVLYRLSGSPAVSGQDDFTDTAEDAWYADAVLWAAQQGLVTGYGNGRFGTNDPVTREQIAAMLWRYAGSPAAGSGTDFADENAISAYAAQAVDWARENQIVNGMTGNRFAPRSSATRAQVATMLMNYLRRQSTGQEDAEKILVAYFSHTGTTEAVAQYIHAQLGGDLFRIEPLEPYESGYGSAERAQQEEQDNARPALANQVENMQQYDTILIGYPIWYHNAPMVIATFLESYDLSGKTVVPFCTSGGSDISESMDLIRSLCGDATLLDGLTANGSQEDIDRWLSGTMEQLAQSADA